MYKGSLTKRQSNDWIIDFADMKDEPMQKMK